MHIAIKVTPMGESINEAKICAFLQPHHSYVKIDQEIVELETDKANQVLYAPAAGQIYWLVQEGDTVKVGEQIGYIDKKQQQLDTGIFPKLNPGTAQNCTEERNSAISKIVEEPSNLPRETRQKIGPLRKAMAERLLQAQKSMAILTTFNEIDMTAVVNMRLQQQEIFTKKYGLRLGLLPFFMKAVVAALQEFPIINASIEADEIVYHNYFDISIAVASERGLVVPVIRNCDKLSFADIEKQIDILSKKAREGKLSINDLQGGSFTISNGGVYGSMLSTPIVNPPQSAILGIHKITKRAVVIDDAVIVRSMMYVALSYDHCLIDGKEAISFLSRIKTLMEDPQRLLLQI